MTAWDDARRLDCEDVLAPFRDQFHLPRDRNGQPLVYLVGNSLGLQPTRTEGYVQQVLTQWRDLAVAAHFTGPFPWMPYHEFLSPPMAVLIGGHPDEVVMMNALTVNLHLMMASFYRPNSRRYKVLLEEHAFPSDRYAVESQIRWHGLDVGQSLVVVSPPAGEDLLSEEALCESIRQQGDSLALVLLPAVQYYTGQRLDVGTITAAVHQAGGVMGLDLAHAAGNVPLSLHEDEVDFAIWCSYKYLNGGPGSVGGCFVHQRHHARSDLPRLAGWWGHDKQTRFLMPDDFRPMPTAESWQVSNPPILSLAAMRASLAVFEEAGGMGPLREKSIKLTGFLQELLNQALPKFVRLLTPRERERRGCQLSLAVPPEQGRRLQVRLAERGVMTDWREPNVVRIAPVPLYNSFQDVARFVQEFVHCLQTAD